MSPGRTAVWTRCIAGSSVGAPALFRARTAGRAAAPRKALALPAGSCRAAACAVCTSATAPATRSLTVASCALRRALACSGPFPIRQGIVSAGCAMRGVRWGSGSEHVRQVGDGRGVPQVLVDPQEGGTRGASLAVQGGLRALYALLQCLLLGAPARARRWLGRGARGHQGALRAPVGARRRGGGYRVALPAGVAGVWEVGGRGPGVEAAKAEVVPPFKGGAPEFHQAGADTAPLLPTLRLPLDCLPRVVREYPVAVEGRYEVILRRSSCPREVVI